MWLCYDLYKKYLGCEELLHVRVNATPCPKFFPDPVHPVRFIPVEGKEGVFMNTPKLAGLLRLANTEILTKLLQLPDIKRILDSYVSDDKNQFHIDIKKGRSHSTNFNYTKVMNLFFTGPTDIHAKYFNHLLKDTLYVSKQLDCAKDIVARTTDNDTKIF